MKIIKKIKKLEFENFIIFRDKFNLDNFTIEFVICHNEILDIRYYLEIQIGNIIKEKIFSNFKELLFYLENFNSYELNKILYL